MKTTADFLDALRAKLNLPSDGRLADYLGMHRQHISRYRTLGVSFDDEMAMRVADILEIDPVYVVACMHHQRAKREEEKTIWARVATMASGTVVGVVFAVILSAAVLEVPVLESGAYVVSTVASNIHYAHLGMVEWLVISLFFLACLLAFPRHNSPKK